MLWMGGELGGGALLLLLTDINLLWLITIITNILQISEAKEDFNVVTVFISYCMEVRERCWFPGWSLLGAECVAKKRHFCLIVVTGREIKQNEHSCEQDFQQDSTEMQWY